MSGERYSCEPVIGIEKVVVDKGEVGFVKVFFDEFPLAGGEVIVDGDLMAVLDEPVHEIAADNSAAC